MSSRDPLQELEEALSFPTSPDFCARVRQQVATEPTRSRFFAGQGLAVAAAVVLTAAIGVIAAYRSWDVEGAHGSRPGVMAAIKPPVEARPAEPQFEAVGAIAPVVLPRAAGMTANAAVTSFETPFETLVPEDQRRALDRLLAAMREGRASVPPTVVDDELSDNGQRVPRALVIEPMKLELLAGTPGEPIKDPVKDPIK